MATNTKKTSSSETAKPPVAKLQDGRIFLSIWERATDKGRFYSITLERRYKNKNEEWASSRSLNEDDLLGASELPEAGLQGDQASPQPAPQHGRSLTAHAGRLHRRPILRNQSLRSYLWTSHDFPAASPEKA